MVWAKLDDQLLDNEKVMEVSNDAFTVWILSIVFCARNLTDGIISTTQLKRIAAMRFVGMDVIEELVEHRMIEIADGAYLVHDFLDYNPDREEVERLEAERSEAGRRGGLRSAEMRRAKSEANAKARAEANASPSAQATTQAKSNPGPGPGPGTRYPVPEIPSPTQTASGITPTEAANEPPEETVSSPGEKTVGHREWRRWFTQKCGKPPGGDGDRAITWLVAHRISIDFAETAARPIVAQGETITPERLRELIQAQDRAPPVGVRS